MNEEFQIDVYETEKGKLPYSEWESILSVKDRAVITTRLVRIRRGNFGDCKPINLSLEFFRSLDLRESSCGWKITMGFILVNINPMVIYPSPRL